MALATVKHRLFSTRVIKLFAAGTWVRKQGAETEVSVPPRQGVQLR